MTEHQIALLYPNGQTFDRWAIHAEANPDEEWRETLDSCPAGYTAVRYVNGLEVDRFHNCAAFARG